MRKLLPCLFLLLSAFSLFGCDRPEEEDVLSSIEKKRRLFVGHWKYTSIYIEVYNKKGERVYSTDVYASGYRHDITEKELRTYLNNNLTFASNYTLEERDNKTYVITTSTSPTHEVELVQVTQETFTWRATSIDAGSGDKIISTQTYTRFTP